MVTLLKHKKLSIFLILFVSLIFRLWVTDKAWHVDLWSNAAWGEWIYEHGPAKFYENSVWTYSWPTQPPLTNLVYAFNKHLYIELLGRIAGVEFQINKILPGNNVPWLSDFVRWFGYGKINTEIPFQIGFLVTMKLFPILSDIVIAIIIYLVGKKKIIWPAIYLFSPFSWYISAGWGQYDGVGFCLALLGFLCTFSAFSILGPGLITLAILIKPTSLILLPFFGYVYLRKFKKILDIKILGLLLPLILFWVTTQPFTYKNPFEFTRYDLTRIVFEKAEPRISVNAINFWRIFIGNAAKRDNLQVLSLFIFGLFNILGVYHFEKQKRTMESTWESLFIIAMGSFLFMTGMLDRYAFAGVIFGLLVVIKKQKLFKFWLVLSLIFWINLFYHWWLPGWLEPLKQILTWNQDLITRILALVQVILFAKLTLESFRTPPVPQVLKRKTPV